MTDNTPAKGWTIYGVADALKDREPIEYIVDGVFQRASLNILYGAPGSLKSLLLADCAAAVVSGDDWLPGAIGDAGNGLKVKQSPALWIDLDNGTRRTHERMGAVARARNLTPDAQLHYMSMPAPPIDVFNIELMTDLILLARDDLQAGLMVVDNLGLLTGDTDENSAAMAKVMGTLRIVAERTNAAVVVVHHQRKTNGNGPSKARVGETLRGHSSIEAALDLALLVMREPDGASVIVKHTKSRGAEPPQVAAHFHYTHKPGTNELETAWFSGAPALRGEDAIRAAIVDVVNKHEQIGKERLIEHVRESMGASAPGVNKVRNLLADMIAEGDELTEQRKGNHHLVTVPNGQYKADFS